MRSTLLFARYLVFVLFVICNAIISSVSVWNRSLLSGMGQMMQIDIYLTFLGVFSLFFIFSIIFTEILNSSPFTGLVWFECTWIVLFWVLELSGAAAITAVAPEGLCSIGAASACISTRVLQAFSWICTIGLLIYMCLLMTTMFYNHKHKFNQHVWQTSVRTLRLSDLRHCLQCSLPDSPISSLATAFKNRAPVTVQAPLPRRPVPDALYTHRAGLSSEYEIEHFGYVMTSSVEKLGLPKATYMAPAMTLLPPAAHVHLSRRSDHSVRSGILVEPSMPSLYPMSLQSYVHQRTNSLQPPSPLGEWPRPYPLEQPVARRATREFPPTSFTFPPRKNTERSSGEADTTLEFPPSSFVFPSGKSAERSSGEVDRASSSANIIPRKRKPSGPRSRPNSSGSQQKPTLDLSSISA